MDYRLFMKLMDAGDAAGKDSISTLQEFVKEFPYFQSAHALLAKTMHEQQHVRYEKQLKIAAAYAGDRKSLYNLIHPGSIKLFSDQPASGASPFISVQVREINESENIFIDSGNATVIPPFDDESISVFPAAKQIEINPPSTFFREEIIIPEAENEDEDEPMVADPHDIIRRRLIEILGLKTEEKKRDRDDTSVSESKKETIADYENRAVISTDNNESLKHEVINDLSESPEMKNDLSDKIQEGKNRQVDDIDKGEIEYALETSLIKSLEKLPLVERQASGDKTDSGFVGQKENSFFDWLKIKSASGYGKVEEVHAYETTNTQQEIVIQTETQELEEEQDNPEPKKSEDINQLIDRFIQAEPRIVPSKSEFYSPVNQAKKSITENEDLVSETLAKIYHQQGNLLKARTSYQKLSLLYPEKMAYFAALISEIDKSINNLNKQDL